MPFARASSISIRVFYPADPIGVIAGGVDTFIRGVLKFAPVDLNFSLIGMSTDVVKRPLGKWMRPALGGREFDFLPIVTQRGSEILRLPLSFRYTSALALRRRELMLGINVFDFHRIEPALIFCNSGIPMNAFFHQDMSVLRSAHSDIGWKYMPSAYFRMEDKVIRSLSSVWCVRQGGVDLMRNKHPTRADSINFVPTWVDTDFFSPVGRSSKESLRSIFSREFNLDPGGAWILSVGRLDKQKDPELLIRAFHRLRAGGDLNCSLILVGDGVMNSALRRLAQEIGISDRVFFAGLRDTKTISDLMRASDVFALSSAYEGMPMAVLEALGSGLPVVATDVGEIRLVVSESNGRICESRDVNSYARCLEYVIRNSENLGGQRAVDAILEFTPETVLASVYENYRRISASAARNYE